jgi:hypothetical protein
MTPLFIFLTLALSDALTVDKDRYTAIPDDGTYYLEEAHLVPDTSVGTSAGDYRTLTISDGSNTLGTLTTNSSGGAAWVAGTPAAFTLSGGKNREFTGKTESLKVASAHTGSTGAVVDGRIVLKFSKLAI